MNTQILRRLNAVLLRDTLASRDFSNLTSHQTLLAILKSKEGDDNWLAAGRQSDETKDGLRRKISSLENCITDLKRDVDVLQQNAISHRYVNFIFLEKSCVTWQLYS